MADIRPLRGLRYNPQVAGELTHAICPPFDTISLELQKSLYQRSAYNVVRLEAGETLPSDTPQDNHYTRAAALFLEWIGKQVLVREKEPAFYLVKHKFKSQGRYRARLELIACVRLEPYERRVVLPHEYTIDKDKEDRLSLIQACNANFSPIMCLYRDEEKRLSPIFQQTMAETPLMELSDSGEQGYRMWKIADRRRITDMTEAMVNKPLYIADGHHRYETALNYEQLVASRGIEVHSHAENRTGTPEEPVHQEKSPDTQGTKDEAPNFVMMGLIEFDDPGLMVLPYHRVLGGLDDTTLTQIRGGLGELFDIELFPAGDGARLDMFLQEIERRGRDQLIMGLLDPARDGTQLLTLKRGVGLDAWGPVARSEAWILEEQVLKPVLGHSLARCLAYVHDGEEAEKGLKSGEYQLGFMLKPFALDLFQTIMNQGQRLPPKSTFFYPKLATGLVINLLEGEL